MGGERILPFMSNLGLSTICLSTLQFDHKARKNICPSQLRLAINYPLDLCTTEKSRQSTRAITQLSSICSTYYLVPNNITDINEVYLFYQSALSDGHFINMAKIAKIKKSLSSRYSGSLINKSLNNMILAIRRFFREDNSLISTIFYCINFKIFLE